MNSFISKAAASQLPSQQEHSNFVQGFWQITAPSQRSTFCPPADPSLTPPPFPVTLVVLKLDRARKQKAWNQRAIFQTLELVHRLEETQP